MAGVFSVDRMPVYIVNVTMNYDDFSGPGRYARMVKAAAIAGRLADPDARFLLAAAILLLDERDPQFSTPRSEISLVSLA